MISIIIAMAATSTVPQFTTPEGYGHHSNDPRREEAKKGPHKPAESKEAPAQKTEKDVRRKPNAPAENRDADGALMPGAPGTNDPTIPGATS